MHASTTGGSQRVPGRLALVLGFAFLAGCSNTDQMGAVENALPNGLDRNALAKTLAGTWENQMSLRPLPDGSVLTRTYRMSFVFNPDRFRHGTCITTTLNKKGAWQTNGEGTWEILESERQPDGSYQGRILKIDTRGGSSGDLANSSGGRSNFRMTADTIAMSNPHLEGSAGSQDLTSVWKKIPSE